MLLLEITLMQIMTYHETLFIVYHVVVHVDLPIHDDLFGLLDLHFLV